jgi:hypothetical protein
LLSETDETWTDLTKTVFVAFFFCWACTFMRVEDFSVCYSVVFLLFVFHTKLGSGFSQTLLKGKTIHRVVRR